jgi:hypothetical protein
LDASRARLRPGHLECRNDRAITQDLLPTDHVANADLVPFDNNIAQRNLVPASPSGRTLRGFFITNPYPEVTTVRLGFDSSLPLGWRWQTNLANTADIRLAPLERRWVEMTIDQAEGQEITQFDQPQQLTVTGTIGERHVGGITFYAAPRPACGEELPAGQVAGGEVKSIARRGEATEPLSLSIPWAECDFEGELDMRIRFRKK